MGVVHHVEAMKGILQCYSKKAEQQQHVVMAATKQKCHSQL
jgi:hypothetical protein